MARELEQHRDAMRAYAAFLRAAVAYVRFLQARGRLGDAESVADLRMLEAECERTHHRLRLQPDRPLALPADPVARLALAARRQLRLYREAVCDESRALRARSGALRRRSRDQRRGRTSEPVPRSDAR